MNAPLSANQGKVLQDTKAHKIDPTVFKPVTFENSI